MVGYGQNIYTRYYQRFLYRSEKKETELLVEYRAEIDSLYQQRPINHEQIDETQNKIDLIEQRSLKGAMVRSRTKFIENEETLQNSFTQQKLFSKNTKP